MWSEILSHENVAHWFSCEPWPGPAGLLLRFHHHMHKKFMSQTYYSHSMEIHKKKKKNMKKKGTTIITRWMGKRGLAAHIHFCILNVTQKRNLCVRSVLRWISFVVFGSSSFEILSKEPQEREMQIWRKRKKIFGERFFFAFCVPPNRPLLRARECVSHCKTGYSNSIGKSFMPSNTRSDGIAATQKLIYINIPSSSVV